MTQNPLATPEQREVENLALRLIERPELRQARDLAAILFRNALAWPLRDQMDRFEPMLDEYLFHYAMRAANGDALYPRIARFMAPPHRWFGRPVPGSRWAGDSPDFIYRVIPVAHGRRYELHGTPCCPDLPQATFALMANNNAAPVTQALLDSLDMAMNADGSFVITIDAGPANGRPNHLQTKPGADHILIRDALGDWLTQSPNALRIDLLDQPDRGPMAEAELAQRAATNLKEGLYYTCYCMISASGQAPNTTRIPGSSGAFGGMATQYGTKGNVFLKDDEALIVTANGAGALFRNTVLCDGFFLSLDYWTRTGSLNMHQMRPDQDGAFTYVVAHQDPGIHNWLDTGGLNQTIWGHRWQAFRRDGATQIPTLAVRTAKFSALDSALPPGVHRITPLERQAQLAQREAGYRRRFIDN